MRKPIVLAGVLLCVGCGDPLSPDDPLPPGSKKSGPTVLAGADVSDTVLAPVPALLVVEARRAGQLQRGAVLTFVAQDVGGTLNGFLRVCDASLLSCTASDVAYRVRTDSLGRARARVQLGRVAGTGRVIISLQGETISDTATYTVRPGAPVRYSGFSQPLGLLVGTSLTLSGTLFDAYGNTTPITPTVAEGTGQAIRVDATRGAITALDMGTQRVYARAGLTAVDSALVSVYPTGRVVGVTDIPTAIRYSDIFGGVDVEVPLAGTFPNLVSNVSAARNHLTIALGFVNFGIGSDRRVAIIDSTGIVSRVFRPDSGFSSITKTRLLADGTLLIVGSVYGRESVGFALYRGEPDGRVTHITELSRSDVGPRGADISPDGRRVAYITFDPVNGSNPVRVLDRTTGRVTTVAPNGREPVFSPTGDRLAFVATPVGSNALLGDLSVVNVDGTGRRLLIPGSYGIGITWSPDGSMVLAGQFTTERSHVIVRIADMVSVTLPRQAVRNRGYVITDWWR